MMKWLREIDFSTTSYTETFDKELESKSLGNCEGFLFIQSRSLWRFPNHLWKRRYFTLQNDNLYFTKDPNELIFDTTTPKIEIEADTGIYAEESTRGQKKYFIRIQKEKQSFLLCSGEENDRNTWLASLLTVITQKYVANFKAGSYKSIRLNYKPIVKPDQQRHSSFVPKRVSSESHFSARDNNNEEEGNLSKSESLFNLNVYKELMYQHRTSCVALG